jgi:glycosyltransferase involved in cell wall biosynthesis
MGEASVSVVVTAYNSVDSLERCLNSLSRQPAVEVIVSDCSDVDPTPRLRARFPEMKFLRFDERRSIPELRREAVRIAKGDILAVTEGWMIPAADWVERLVEAHAAYPEDPAIGGTIAFVGQSEDASAFDWADYFTEYGFHMPGGPDGHTGALTGPNVSYKRWAVELCRPLFEQARWEPFIHGFLQEKGYQLRRVDGAMTVYRKPADPVTVLRQRFRYGRWHAAERGKPWGLVERLARATIWPAIAALLLLRLWRAVAERPAMRRPFFRALGWVTAQYSAWALGEAVGYLFGKGSKKHPIY